MKGFLFYWTGSYLKEALKIWYSFTLSIDYLSLPSLPIWISWIAWNKATFEDCGISPELYGYMSLATMNCMPHVKNRKKVRVITQEQVDRSYHWCFFNGASQGEPASGDVEGIIYSFDTKWTKFYTALGINTNNRDELLALKINLQLALSKGIQRIQAFEDSSLVIK